MAFEKFKDLFADHKHYVVSIDVSKAYGYDFSHILSMTLNHFFKLRESNPNIKEFYYTEYQMLEDGGVSYYKRKKFFKKAEELGLLSVILKGIPRKAYITLNLEKIKELADESKMARTANRENGDKQFDRLRYTKNDNAVDEIKREEYPECQVALEDVEDLADWIVTHKEYVRDPKAYRAYTKKHILAGTFNDIGSYYGAMVQHINTRDIERIENLLDGYLLRENPTIEKEGDIYRFNTTEFRKYEIAPGENSEIFTASYVNERHEGFYASVSKDTFYKAIKEDDLQQLHKSTREIIKKVYEDIEALQKE